MFVVVCFFLTKSQLIVLYVFLIKQYSVQASSGSLEKLNAQLKTIVLVFDQLHLNIIH